MKKVKKIWAALLSLAMILAIVPQTMAAGEEAVRYVGFDSGTKTEAVVNDGDSGAALYQSWGINVQWQRISSGISITSGAHTMNLQYTHRDENMTHIIIADAIMIVPSDWGLTADDIKNKSAIETALYTDALEQVKYLENVYGDSVRYVKNLDLYKRGSAGNVILYSSLTPDILSDNGAIVYPAEGSDMGVLNIVAENGDVQSDAMQYYFTVYPNNGITISNFAINGELVANAEVTASVDIKYTDAAEKKCGYYTCIDRFRGQTQKCKHGKCCSAC